MRQDRYVFPTVLTIAQDGVSVEFPDLPGCLTCGETEEEALLMAKNALELHLYGMEEENEKIPTASKISSLRLEKNQLIALVDVWLPPIRDEMAQKAVKKTLTIPKWLNDLAEKKKVNFSHLLQSALKEHLGANDYKSKQQKP